MGGEAPWRVALENGRIDVYNLVICLLGLSWSVIATILLVFRRQGIGFVQSPGGWEYYFLCHLPNFAFNHSNDRGLSCHGH